MAWAQQLLAGGGYSVPVSGYFQASTQAAVYAFQRDHGLPQTGNLDVPTWGPAAAEQAAAGALGERRRRRAREGVGAPRAAAAEVGEAACGPERDPAAREARLGVEHDT